MVFAEDEHVDHESRLQSAIEEIHEALPERETVELAGEVYNVDNSWVYKALEEVTKANTEDQPEKIRQLIETLQALDERITERQQPGRAVDSKEQAKSKLQSILARPEYATGSRGPNALTRLLQRFFRWLQSLFPKRTPMSPGSATWFIRLAQVVVIGGALFVLIYVGRLLFGRLRRSKRLHTSKKREPRIVLGERLEPEQTATDLLAEAEALARNGDVRAAIRKAYIALLVELGDRKMISLAQYKTNRDYLNSIRTIPQLHLRMRGLTDSFERHWYGFVDATPNDWQDFRTGYVAALRTEN